MEVGVARAGARTRRLAELYAQHIERATAVAFLITGDAHLAEELAQEAFVRAAGRIGSLRDQSRFGAYLNRAVVNQCYAHFRDLKRERRYVEQAASRPSRASESAVDIPTRDMLWRALQQLPPRQRAAIVLRHYMDMSERETAHVLDCAVGTVKSLVSRGLATLRESIEQGDE